MGMADKGSYRDSGGLARRQICGTTGKVAMEIREDGNGGGRDEGQRGQ